MVSGSLARACAQVRLFDQTIPQLGYIPGVRQGLASPANERAGGARGNNAARVYFAGRGGGSLDDNAMAA